MQRLLKRYLPFSGFLILAACSSVYKSLEAVPADAACVERMRPVGIETAWYATQVDVIGKHLSGLLLIKNMPDRSRRVVFTNEVGITFFDFGFAADGQFKVYDIVAQMDKKPVIETLRKDFELLLGIPFAGELQAWKTPDELYTGAVRKKETAYFVTDATCSALHRLELGSKRKQKVTIVLHGADRAKPDSVAIKHYTFAMAIGLKKIER